jgi:hypothetical protein
LLEGQYLAGIREQVCEQAIFRSAQLYRKSLNEHPVCFEINDQVAIVIKGRFFDRSGSLYPAQDGLSLGQLYDLDGYRFRATLETGKTGKYSFESVMPGHYPARVCQHIHYVVTAEGHKPLITQLYFATDSAFEGDPDRNYSRDPLIMSRELVRPVMLTGDPKTVQAEVTFEVILERL